ncbi:FAR-17a/AIG1-like protein [Mucidula mucida]|nr:FAR-17a/AIG1-like protein [Mucidula mucida]
MLAAFSTPLNPHGTLFEGQFGGSSQFLTIHGLFVAVAAMSFGILVDAKRIVFRSIKRFLIMVAMPLEAVVSSIYWSLIFVFPSLILPKASEDITEPTSSSEVPDLFRIPLSVDLGLHALPGLALVLDFMLFEKKYSRKTMSSYALPLATLVTVLYTSWEEYCSSINGVFPYPFLNNTVEVRLAIYAGATAIAYISLRALNAIHP